MLVTHAVLPGMLARGGGRIVNLASGAGIRPLPTYTGYAISKGALSRLTTLLHAQYADRGIRVLDLAPGVVRTEMTESMPVHDDRTSWTSIDDVVALAVAFGAGELDAASGRWVRAGTDTPETLRRDAAVIVERDARTLRLAYIDESDPVA
jgi:short-subunit dehydrogenase